MLIALLAVLGVNLIVIVVLAAVAVGRKRWLRRQRGEFAGAIRVTRGDVHGLGTKWKRGSGRWLRDVFVWNKAPFMFRTVLVPFDRLSGERTASTREVKRLGDEPVVIGFESDDTRIEVAARAEHRALATGQLPIGEHLVERLG
jgi:hypothetical protein